MRDCPKAEMRDALPELLHDTLPSRQEAEVRAHLDGCDACRAELALLARVRAAASAPIIPTERIVSALPAYRRRAPWIRVLGSPALRVAAAVVLLAGGASWVLRSGTQVSAPAPSDSVSRSVPAMELALGETFADVSDSALVSLVDALDDLEATLSEEPEPIVVPLAAAGGT